MHVQFFDQHLKGAPPAAPAPRVRIFVMGIDQWREETDWPLTDTQYTDYYLTSGGAANTSDGDGALQLDAPTAEARDDFRYDPRDPVPTAGGALLPSLPGLIGPVDQRVIDGRSRPQRPPSPSRLRRVHVRSASSAGGVFAVRGLGRRTTDAW
ncbi:CocE/NonD family hydrolase [Streptomyces sp. NPDC058293]|uniref:CocE/NonD family hydrolase n=1 Tax=Streptomyces sp. NPDC058293 TaxID=3346429 RepID=UPI0036ECD5FE